jgi:hypothetical protein
MSMRVLEDMPCEKKESLDLAGWRADRDNALS